ncbi:Helix-turn-helix domain-containing protein [Actinokineospora alba]|uniref:Helix-turn-helix domain-containing protein n=1 Tax=Actinokineospora alba TaxID=504798 RepID=A0A1H0JZJ2_9PSEU|nr:AraC family transcriptional regulator [Actinokineospora alba]TDP68109.1 AraC family transcriptional regulator [Actinokineospora alba]SDH92439.1 Helix-turn-helix domain-containing protein [Actinokineospora alba]SDO48883.1 Helix-turn-helix domain-containing protein [Actinokineospora alba]
MAVVGEKRKGVLGSQVGTKFDLRTLAPSAALAPFVEYYWLVSWDLADPIEQQVLPHPNVHLVFEDEGPLLYGVMRGKFVRRLVGEGHVLGVRFHAGGFRPWLGKRVSSLTDKVVRGFVEPGGVLTAGDADAMVAAAEGVLSPRLPEVDPVVDDIRAMVAAIDGGVSRVDALAREFGLTARSVQRLFSDYVGVGPKWVIRRFRMHEAAARVDSGEDVGWAGLANELGYADQAHFTREFTANIGVSPARYAATLRT